MNSASGGGEKYRKQCYSQVKHPNNRKIIRTPDFKNSLFVALLLSLFGLWQYWFLVSEIDIIQAHGGYTRTHQPLPCLEATWLRKTTYPIWCRSGVDLVSIWGRSGVDLGPIWGRRDYTITGSYDHTVIS